MAPGRNILVRHSLSPQYTIGPDWAKGINVCSQTDVIFSVPHDGLLVKLDFYGIGGQMLSLLIRSHTECLSERNPFLGSLFRALCYSSYLLMAFLVLFSQTYACLQTTVFFIHRGS